MDAQCSSVCSRGVLSATPSRSFATCRRTRHGPHTQLARSRQRHQLTLLRSVNKAALRSIGTRASRLSIVSGPVEKLDAEQLEVAIQERTKPLIIDFFATWCGPCLLLAKELEQVYETMGDSIRIVKVDTDENPDLSSQLQIQGLPTMVFVGMDRSKPALRTEGLLPAETIMDIIRTELMEEQAIDVGATAGVADVE